MNVDNSSLYVMVISFGAVILADTRVSDISLMFLAIGFAIVMVITSVVVSVLSSTVSVKTSFVGSAGAVNVVCADILSFIVTFGVPEVCSQVYMRLLSSPSGSVPEPFRVTILSGANVLSRPAFAVGGWFCVGAVTFMTTVSVSESVPAVTVRVNVIVPVDDGAVNVGCAVSLPIRFALSPEV